MYVHNSTLLPVKPYLYTMEPTILFEDGHLIVLHKPAGIAVEVDKFGYASLEGWVREHLDQKPQPSNAILGIVHRIDRPVSGVVIMAKKKSVLVHLNEQFAKGAVAKTYYAVVSGTPQAGKVQLQHHLVKDPALKKAIVVPKKNRKSVFVTLDYTVLQQKDNLTLLEVHPHSGKYHQIRAQLGAAGLPIVGDALYGSVLPYHKDAIMLHAGKLTVVHPVTNETVTYVADFPADWTMTVPA